MWPSPGKDKQDYNYESFRTTLVTVIVIIFMFIIPARWPHMWPKHVGGYFVIKLYQNIIVHLFALIWY
jgi:hypothetical protein